MPNVPLLIERERERERAVAIGIYCMFILRLIERLTQRIVFFLFILPVIDLDENPLKPDECVAVLAILAGELVSLSHSLTQSLEQCFAAVEGGMKKGRQFQL